MRVVAGEARGRRLRSRDRPGLRPTLDRVREALFSILGDVRGLVVLDLFAGTGALGIEALSRGAARAVFVERDRSTAELVRANLTTTGVSERARLRILDLPGALPLLSADGPFDLVLMDPPYEGSSRDATLEHPAFAGLLAADATVVVEHDARNPPADTVGELVCTDRRRYGSTGLAFYERTVPSREAR